MSTPRPVPGAPLAGPRIVQPSNGMCPTCGQPVLWVRDHTDGADGSAWHAPLDPQPRRLKLGTQVVVAPSTSGAVAAVTPVLHFAHYCPEEAVEALLARVGSLGFYTAEVLSVPCPLNICGAASSMMCLDPRRDALPRPHGARRVLAEGREYRDQDLVD
jgi:hypothetical protein